MMKNINPKTSKPLILLGLILLFNFGCDRDLTDEAVLATFPNTADIYTDDPVGLEDEFFISFDPAEGANPEAFGTDDNEAYEGTSSIRIDVPAPNDPNGNFAGCIFRDRGAGRDLTGYDALTFWARGNVTGSIGRVGFGTDFLEDKFPVSRDNIQLSTDWRKYVIPIPDPSKLTQEKGMFLISVGSFDPLGNDNPADGDSFNDNIGWRVWLDEIRFEKLGTNLTVGAEILNGQDLVQDEYADTTLDVAGISHTVNLGTGETISLNVAPTYFDYNSTNESVAIFNDDAKFEVVGTSGTTTITASLDGFGANGSITITSLGPFPHAPIPQRPQSNVTSLFSDAYDNISVRHYNGFFLPFQTTQGGAGADPENVDLRVDFPDGTPDNIINYTALNFVSIGTYETVSNIDVSDRTHLHLDIFVREDIEPGDFINLQIESGTFSGPTESGFYLLNATTLMENMNEDGWTVLDIPLEDFTGNVDFSSVGQLFFISDATISDIWVDNVYYYAE